jgi:hypothetical protein
LKCPNSWSFPSLHVRARLNVTRNKHHLVEPVDDFGSGIGDVPALPYFKIVGVVSNRTCFAPLLLTGWQR